VLRLLAFVLPLGLDSFAVAAAIGASQAITVRQRLRISLVCVIFEGGMPLIGLGLGAALARGIGQVADYLAGAAVIAIGAWILLAGDKDDEEKAARIITSRGLALIALGLSISLDELAIGFTIGLAHLHVSTVIAAIALQAFIAAQLGLAIGAKIGERWRERAEQAAGIALILLGVYLIRAASPVSAPGGEDQACLSSRLPEGTSC
jgi:putative Mn2+ efflux pump MntP